MELGSCAITRRLAELETIFDVSQVQDATAHKLFVEYETLLDSLWCIADGMSKCCQ